MYLPVSDALNDTSPLLPFCSILPVQVQPPAVLVESTQVSSLKPTELRGAPRRSQVDTVPEMFRHCASISSPTSPVVVVLSEILPSANDQLPVTSSLPEDAA